jgi:hypothetical protein
MHNAKACMITDAMMNFLLPGVDSLLPDWCRGFVGGKVIPA